MIQIRFIYFKKIQRLMPYKTAWDGGKSEKADYIGDSNDWDSNDRLQQASSKRNRQGK